MKTISTKLNLITECINDNRTAQKQLYDLYRVKMYTLCLRYMSNSWIKRIFINTNLEFIRKKRLKIEDINPNDFQFSSTNNEPIEHMSLQELVRVLQELPIGYRSVFNLYVLEGYTHKEIAETLNISLSTSKTQLMKAKRMMQAKVQILNVV